MIIPSRHRTPCVIVGLAAGMIGALAARHYHRLGLTLSHYDARGHLVVARRIFDSITPGWQQIGAVWLPLPHLLNALPVQVDFFYRTGASGVAISCVSFALGIAALTSIVLTLTGSVWAAAAGAAVMGLNPNILYLQATPMTEPLLLGLTLAAVALLLRWCAVEAEAGGVATDRMVGPTSRLVGLTFGLACLTRYEAWPVTATALTLAVWARWRDGNAWSVAIARVATIAAYPAVAIVGFLIFSRAVVGQWFVSTGFFVPENPAQGHAVAAASEIIWGMRMLSGYALTGIAAAGAIGLAIRALTHRRRAGDVIPLALFATAALPWLAFLDGHPYRIRYMVPLVAAEAAAAALLTGILASRSRTAGAIAAVALVGLAAFERQPLDARAAMVTEASWDRPNVAVRQRVTACLRAGYQQDTIMASMGSLGHYMQELSGAGFAVRDFLHEGNGDIWLRALEAPRPYVGWILIEEQAEGGDMLAKIARENPHFLDGFSRVCDGAGVALYRRQNRMLTVAR